MPLFTNILISDRMKESMLEYVVEHLPPPFSTRVKRKRLKEEITRRKSRHLSTTLSGASSSSEQTSSAATTDPYTNRRVSYMRLPPSTRNKVGPRGSLKVPSPLASTNGCNPLFYTSLRTPVILNDSETDNEADESRLTVPSQLSYDMYTDTPGVFNIRLPGAKHNKAGVNKKARQKAQFTSPLVTEHRKATPIHSDPGSDVFSYDNFYYVPDPNNGPPRKEGGGQPPPMRSFVHNNSIYIVDSTDAAYLNALAQSVDPVERVHFILEGDADHPTDPDQSEFGRLFIQMDTLKYLRIGPNGEIIASTSPPVSSSTSSTGATSTPASGSPEKTIPTQTNVPADKLLEPLSGVNKLNEYGRGSLNGTEKGTIDDAGKASLKPTKIEALKVGSNVLKTSSSATELGAGSPLNANASSVSPVHSVRDIPVWEEVARWVKFEEDVEPGSNRWSKPRVATLALHSLLELRSCILNGLLILDMEGTNSLDVENSLISSLLTANQITSEIEDDVRKLFRAPHIPQYMKISAFRNVASKTHFPNISSQPSAMAQTGLLHAKLSNLANLNSPVQPTASSAIDSSTIAALRSQSLITSPTGHDQTPYLLKPSTITSNAVTDPQFQNSSQMAQEIAVGHPQFITKAKSMVRLKNYFAAGGPTAVLKSCKLTSTGRIFNNNTSGKKKHQQLLHHSKTSPGPLSPTGTHHTVGSGETGENNDTPGFPMGMPHPKFGNIHFMKKLPENAEAAHVFIGEALFLKTPIIAFLRFRDSIYLADTTEVPIPSRFMFILIGPLGYIDRYHEIGRCLGTLMSDEVFHDVAYKAKNIQDILAGVDEFLDQVIVLPPGEWDPTIRIQPPLNVPSQINRVIKKDKTGGTDSDIKPVDHFDSSLVRTGKFCGGLIGDLRRKLPWYWSDFKDGISMQCIASFFFLYFACLAPIVTFGGLLSDATGHNLATIESLVSGAVCGIAWALFAGQPLTIMGSTGPILVFESIVYTFSRDHGWNFLSFRCCIGLWTALILLVMVMTDASVLVKYVTRFTEELFASLISLIFVYQAFKNIWHIGEEFPVHRHNPLPPGFINTKLNGTSATPFTTVASLLTTTPGGIIVANRFVPYVSDVFFLSIVLFAGTFFLSAGLKSLRNTTYFPMSVRYLISDFAVLIAVMIALGCDFYFGLATPKLLVPSSFRPTSSERGGWFVNPLDKRNPWWTCLASFFPALLATILIFLDQQITAVIINRKENLLKKGCGYHLDLLVVAILVAVCSLLGIPWFVAATVLSITHVNSLRKETECAAPGERPKFLGVREQRLTGLTIFVFIGLSVSMTKVLQFIPMPVLYGIFLYMGISSLKGVQFIQRISILFMPQKYQPDYMFLRSVKTYRVHLFTLIQAASLAALWAIKSYKTISICFPLMVAALVGIRKLMERIFTSRELSVLDDLMPESEKKRKSISSESDLHDVSVDHHHHHGHHNAANGGDEHGKHGTHKRHHHKKQQRKPGGKNTGLAGLPFLGLTNRFRKLFAHRSNNQFTQYNHISAGTVNQPNQSYKQLNNILSTSSNLPAKARDTGIIENGSNKTKGSYLPLATTDMDELEHNDIKSTGQHTLVEPLLKDHNKGQDTSFQQNKNNFNNGINFIDSITSESSVKDNATGTDVNHNNSTLSKPLIQITDTSTNTQKSINEAKNNNNATNKRLPHISSMTDTMNITREVEKTAVWKSLAKEKFLINNSASSNDMLLQNQQHNADNQKGAKNNTKHRHSHHRVPNEKSKKPNGLAPKNNTVSNFAAFEEPTITATHAPKSESRPHKPSNNKFSIKIGSDDDDDSFPAPKSPKARELLKPQISTYTAQNLPPPHQQDSVIVDPAQSTVNAEDPASFFLDTPPLHNFADRAYASDNKNSSNALSSHKFRNGANPTTSHDRTKEHRSSNK